MDESPPAELSTLPETRSPQPLDEGVCPWQRYAIADHSSWAARTDAGVVVRGQAAARSVLSDRRFLQGIRLQMERNSGLDPRFVARRMEGLLLRDGPDHLRMRKLAAKAFTPRAADRHRPLMREVMESLADAVPPDGVCDAIATLTHRYPTQVICHVLGAPMDDVDLFSSLTETILNAQSGAPEAVEHALAAHQQLDAYMLELIERKRSDLGADLLSDLIQAEAAEGSLSTDEILNIAVSVIMAGTDTTRNQLALGLHLLADHPGAWASLGPGNLERAVEEIIRFAPIGHVLLRAPDEDVVLNGLRIPEGTMVILDVGAANRDPDGVAGPDTFDIGRDAALPHLGFGHGHKFCLGANLARAELVEALRVLRGRFEHIEHAGPVVWRRVGFVQGPIELPLRLR